MVTKILISNRSDNGLKVVVAKPNCLVCASHAGEFPAENPHV